MIRMGLEGSTVIAGENYTTLVVVEVPASASFGACEGTVHVRSGKRTVPQTLAWLTRVC